MSKLFATIENETGKKASKAGNEYLDIDIYSGNRRIAALTVRENESGEVAVYDENDNIVNDTPYKGSKRESDDEARNESKGELCAHCGEPLYGLVRVHHHTENGKDVTMNGVYNKI